MFKPGFLNLLSYISKILTHDVKLPKIIMYNFGMVDLATVVSQALGIKFYGATAYHCLSRPAF